MRSKTCLERCGVWAVVAREVCWSGVRAHVSHTETVRLLDQRVADLDAEYVEVGTGLGEIRTEVALAAANVHVDGLRLREREVLQVERSRELEASLQWVDVRANVPLGAHALAPHGRGRPRRSDEGRRHQQHGKHDSACTWLAVAPSWRCSFASLCAFCDDRCAVLLLSGDYWGVRASIAHSPPPPAPAEQ